MHAMHTSLAIHYSLFFDHISLIYVITPNRGSLRLDDIFCTDDIAFTGFQRVPGGDHPGVSMIGPINGGSNDLQNTHLPPPFAGFVVNPEQPNSRKISVFGMKSSPNPILSNNLIDAFGLA